MVDVSSATYYVRTDGNNTNSGLSNTSGGAWLTIQRSVTNAVAGDTVSVQDGTYPEKVITRSSGSEESPITFSAASTNVIIGGFTISNSYISLVGFTVNGTNVGSYEGVIEVKPGGNNSTIRSNRLSIPYRGHAASKFLYLMKFSSPSESDNSTPKNSLVDGNFFGDTEQK